MSPLFFSLILWENRYTESEAKGEKMTEEKKAQIKEQLRKLPEKPGVYIMKDKYGNIIYIGKSKSLKNRVSSYFRAFNSHAIKVQVMVTNVSEFEYIITDSELEALMLEATLVKKHKPRFNILLKDDKSYPYIKITMKDKYPRVVQTRKMVNDKAKYFGPYMSAHDVNKTLEVIRKLFPVRECNKNLNKNNKSRPCLNFHIKRCMGPCTGNVSPEEYMHMIQEIIKFLNGNYKDVIKMLEVDMQQAAEEYRFEDAAEFRDKINAIVNMNNKQKMIGAENVEQDAISVDIQGDDACVMIFFVRNGKMIGREQFTLTGIEGSTEGEILSSFVKQFYAGVSYIPKEILISDDIEDKELVGQWLAKRLGGKVRIHIPQKGDKKKLVELVRKNAQEYLEKFESKINTEKELHSKILGDLKDALDMDREPYRVEAYDISNIYGVFSVGSMVVYENCKKKRSDYRRFKIKTIEGPNDYGSMQEVLFRRFRRGLEERALVSDVFEADSKRFNMFPDLLLIDGGVGHVHAVEDVLKALGLDIKVAGMVKDDYHKTNALYCDGEMIEIKSNQELYRFIYGIQEEVHRFAIEYHKSLRDKAMVQSILDDIEGVGETRRKNLLRYFKSIEKIQNASKEELLKVQGINGKVADAILLFFHENKEIKDSGDQNDGGKE